MRGVEAAVTGTDHVTRRRCWHDGGVSERLRTRHLVVAASLSLGVLAAGCGRDEAAVPATIDQREATATLSTNPFIPDDVNIGDCVSSLPRPGCGNEIRGDAHSMLTFGALVAGLGFIGWRIGRGVRRRGTPGPTSAGTTTSSPAGPTERTTSASTSGSTSGTTTGTATPEAAPGTDA